MNDGLREHIELQIRERSMFNNADMEARMIEMMSEDMISESPEKIKQTVQEMVARRVENDVAQTLPFALEIAERDGVTDRLSDDQYDEAGIMAAKLNLQHTLERFETRLQNAPNMRPERRQFAEAFLAMSKTNEALMAETFADPRNITEGDLERTSKIIAADLGKLTQQRLDRAGQDVARRKSTLISPVRIL